jgi:hypothetical protein
MNLPILKTDGHLIPLLFYFFHITLSCFLSQSESPKVITFGEAKRASRDQRSSPLVKRSGRANHHFW